jgi:hypothetical protein
VANTQNSAAVDLANQVAAAMVSSQALLRTLQNLQTRLNAFNVNNGAQSVWLHFPTAASGSDGTLGTADGSPVQTNPMDTRTPTCTGLSVAASYAQYTAAQTAIGNIITTLNAAGQVAAYQPFNQGT